MKKVKEPAQHVKAAQIEKEAVRALSEEEVEEALTASTFGPRKPEGDQPKAHTLEDTFEEFREKNEEDIEILKAELKDRIQECIDLKKTISKIQQQHEAEVADLKDRLMEKEAECNAIRKSKNEILQEREQYSDALDDDSVAFEAILDLAHIAQSMSQSLYKVSKRIEAETEGRI